MLKLLWERKKLHIVKDIFVLGFNHSSMWVYLKSFHCKVDPFILPNMWSISASCRCVSFSKKAVFQKPPLQEREMGNVQCMSGWAFVWVCAAHSQTSMCERFSVQKQTRCLLTGDVHVVWSWCIYTGYIRLCKLGFKNMFCKMPEWCLTYLRWLFGGYWAPESLFSEWGGLVRSPF